MSPLIVLFFLHYLTCCLSANLTFPNNRHLRQIIGPGHNSDQELHLPARLKTESPVVVRITSSNKTKTTPSVPKVTNSTLVKNETKVEEHNVIKPTEMESGALLRGVAVVVVLTTIVILYMALRTYCGKKMKNPVMVSKYGVRTRRSDIEMTPLPLDEDEEDETVFELNSTNR